MNTENAIEASEDLFDEAVPTTIAHESASYTDE